MERFIIQGGKQLNGAVKVAGSKNSVLAILAATLLTKDECIIDNVPLIGDVMKMIEILESIGVKIEWIGAHKLRIQAKDVDPEKMDYSLVGSIRASILLIGSLLARFKKFKISHPGGCIIGARPVGVHFEALEDLGVKITLDDKFYYFEVNKLIGKKIILKEFSVTATENLMMAASLAEGITTIKIAAIEPHIQDLGKFLNKMGAKIIGGGIHSIIIKGRKNLHGAEHSVSTDPIEAGTFMIAAAASRGEVLVKDVNPNHLDLVLEKLKEFGVFLEINSDSVLVKAPAELKACKVEARAYPGVPTDLQAPFAVLATQAHGTSLIHDTLYEGRMGYVNELSKMGANALICDPHRVLITGPTPLYGREITSFDLRAGATLIIAALIAEGESKINEARQVDRGYECIEERLRGLGANIKRIKV